VNEINSIDYLKIVYRCLSNQHNQGVFVIRFFIAAGSRHYYLPENKRIPSTTELEGPRHYIKDRPLNPEIKETFPIPIHKKELCEYLVSNFNKEKIREAMDAFGIPADIPENNKAFAIALVEQFDLFLQTDKEDVDNIVCVEFLKLAQLNDAEISEQAVQRETRYSNDAVYLYRNENVTHHDVLCHSIFSHDWVIRNYGRVLWKGRKLVLINQHKNGPRAVDTEIVIPETVAGGVIKITASFDTRGFEGEFLSSWEMHDETGNNCFPNQKPFDFKISVHYKAKKMEE
jgi:hypothetical protein